MPTDARHYPDAGSETFARAGGLGPLSDRRGLTTMVAGARTFSLEETFLSPQILNPPPTRHALLAFLLAIAAVLHIGTAGWGDLYDGAEGHFAGGAREMVESGQWLVPADNGVPLLQTPPLTFWSIAAASKIFGVNATAARLPIAFAMIGLVALTFLIGERLAGYWRGFAAGLILLCSGSSFVPGRIVAPDAIFALFLSGALYCVIRGYQHRKFRRAWFAGVWFCAGLASLTKGLHAILYLAALCGLLAIFFREARLRFRPLLHLTNLLLFFAIGLVLAVVAGFSFVAIAWFRPAILGTLFDRPPNDAAWLSLRSLFQIGVVSLLAGTTAALVLLKQRGEITLVLALATMIPIGGCLIESRARVAPFFSLADAARYLNPRLGRHGEVMFSGAIQSGSSLAFYLEKKFFLVNQLPGLLETDAASQNKYLDEHFVLEAWDRSDPIYLIIEEDRLAHWRQLITDRVHIYHQVTTCGSRVILR